MDRRHLIGPAQFCHAFQQQLKEERCLLPGTQQCLENLEPASLRQALNNLEFEELDCSSDRRLSISGNRVRGIIEGDPFVAISGEAKPDDQVRAFSDALYWADHKEIKGRTRFYLGSSDRLDQVAQAVGTLNACLSPPNRVTVYLDGIELQTEPADFSSSRPDWLEKLVKRDEKLMNKPDLVEKLESLVDHEEFRWHLTVTNPSWSGRVGGLRICEIDEDGGSGVLSVGRIGSEHDAAEAFRSIVPTQTFEFTIDNVDEAARYVRRFAEGRDGHGDPEHLLEDRLLRGKIDLSLDDGNREFEPLLEVSQVPALWSEPGTSRYTDLLVKEVGTDVPWVIEIKAGTPGQYYRHAVGQATLYREFIRGAKLLDPWYQGLGVDPKKCRAAIVFPKILESDRLERLKSLNFLGQMFDVEIIELKADV